MTVRISAGNFISQKETDYFKVEKKFSLDYAYVSRYWFNNELYNYDGRLLSIHRNRIESIENISKLFIGLFRQNQQQQGGWVEIHTHTELQATFLMRKHYGDHFEKVYYGEKILPYIMENQNRFYKGRIAVIGQVK